MTVGQYRTFLRETGYSPEKGCRVWDGEWKLDDARNWDSPGFSQTDDHPVACVSWEDARRYIGWLNSKVAGDPYRLPSEAEWEYAARARTVTAYPWGTDANAGCEMANGGDQSLKSGIPDWKFAVSNCRDGHVYTAPVARFRANAFTLQDMIGNVWEWTEDCWHDSYANARPTAVPWLSANGGDCSRRALRGGSWNLNPRGLRAAFRDWDGPGNRSNLIGFRPARTLVAP